VLMAQDLSHGAKNKAIGRWRYLTENKRRDRVMAATGTAHDPTKGTFEDQTDLQNIVRKTFKYQSSVQFRQRIGSIASYRTSVIICRSDQTVVPNKGTEEVTKRKTLYPTGRVPRRQTE
jgi:hypothetical protein